MRSFNFEQINERKLEGQSTTDGNAVEVRGGPNGRLYLLLTSGAGSSGYWRGSLPTPANEMQ